MLDTSIGAWLLSTPKTDDMWYEKLRTTSSSDGTVLDINVPNNECTKGQCFSISNNSKFPQKFVLNRLSCNEKRAAICRINPGMTNVPVKPPTFPCMTQIDDKRVKRSKLPGNGGVETGTKLGICQY